MLRHRPDTHLGKGEEQRHVGFNTLLLQDLARPDALPGGGNLQQAPNTIAINLSDHIDWAKVGKLHSCTFHVPGRSGHQ